MSSKKNPRDGVPLCAARKKDGSPCTQPRKHEDTDKCHWHGGATPRGFANPNTKHGRWSKSAPARYASRIEESLADPAYKELRAEISLIDAQIEEALGRLETGEHGALWKELGEAWEEFDELQRTKQNLKAGQKLDDIAELVKTGASGQKARAELNGLIAQRKGLAESERKRAVEEQQVMALQEVERLMGAFADTVARHVHDRKILGAIESDFNSILGHRQGGDLLTHPN